MLLQHSYTNEGRLQATFAGGYQGAGFLQHHITIITFLQHFSSIFNILTSAFFNISMTNLYTRRSVTSYVCGRLPRGWNFGVSAATRFPCWCNGENIYTICFFPRTKLYTNVVFPLRVLCKRVCTLVSVYQTAGILVFSLQLAFPVGATVRTFLQYILFSALQIVY